MSGIQDDDKIQKGLHVRAPNAHIPVCYLAQLWILSPVAPMDGSNGPKILST